jgi:hypothetical protein
VEEERRGRNRWREKQDEDWRWRREGELGDVMFFLC